MALQCNRNLEDHCCWMDNKACIYLEKDENGNPRWTCKLRAELGSWDEVHQDPRYIENVQPFWDKHEHRLGKQSCGNFTCSNCIENGNA